MTKLPHRPRDCKPQPHRPARSTGAFELRAFRALILGACVLMATPAWAAPTDAEKETARSLMDDGDRLRAARDNAGALQRYQAAHDIMKVPTTGIEVAKTLTALGKLVEARAMAIEVANIPVVPREPAVMPAARQEASALAAQLATRIPSATIQVWPKEAQASIFVDSAQIPPAAVGLPYKTNPGEHVVQVTAPGYQTAEQRFTLQEGGSTTVSVNLVAGEAQPETPPEQVPPGEQTPPPAPVEPATPPAVQPDRTRAFIAFGIAGAGAVLGTVTGFMSLSKASSAKKHCNDDVCSPEASDDIDSSKSLATFSNIGFGVAIAAGAWGLYEVLSEPSSPAARTQPPNPHTPRVSVAWVPGLAQASVGGSF